MGLRVFAVDPGGPVPRQVAWQFGCDGDHGMLPSPIQTFTSYQAAMAAGWKETFINDARKFLGPCCSGKTAR